MKVFDLIGVRIYAFMHEKKYRLKVYKALGMMIATNVALIAVLLIGRSIAL